MFVPLRVEDATVDRLPVVSIAIAGLCAVVFALTWLLPSNPMGASNQSLGEIVRYYGEHPYLELQEGFVQDFLSPRAQQKLDAMHQQPPASLDAPTRELEQRHLDSLVEDFRAEANGSSMRRFSLLPARGVLQPGWLTSMFLHFGWMHILGNLFFFYLVGPLLEDLWGRSFFAGFYMAGGFIAAVAHFAMDPHSAVPMAGASGAIAACMGAFTFRCAARKVRIGYWFAWVIRGTFLVPAWAWGGFWFLCEVLSFALHLSGGVAVMAHIGGFLFGFGVAVALQKSGYEARKLSPAVSQKTVWTQHQGTDAARAALASGDKLGAANGYREVLKQQPLDREAAVGLAAIDGDLTRALPLLESLLAKGDLAQAWEIVAELGAVFDPEQVPDRVAWRLAGRAESAQYGAGDLPERLFAAMGRRRGPLAPKALLHAATLSLAGGRLEDARRHLAAALELPAIDPELRRQLDAFAAQLDPGPPPISAPPAHASPGAVRILACRLVRLAEDALHLESAAGQQRKLEFGRLAGVAAGMVKTDQGVAILTDLILSFGQDGQSAAAIRIAGAQLGLSGLFPGVPPKDAYAKFLGHVLARMPGEPLPSREALTKGDYPRFQSIAALNAAFYGRARQ